MTIDELIKLLGLDAEKAEQLKKFAAEKDGEIEKYKGEIKIIKATSKGDKTKLKEAEQKAEKILDALGIDTDDEDIETAIETALKGKTADPAMQKKIAKLEKQLKDKETELTAQLAEERGKRIDGVKRTTLMKALADNKISDVDLVAEMLMAKLKVDDDTESLSFDDAKCPKIDDYIKNFAKEHPRLVAVDQKSGADSLHIGNAPSGTNTDFAKQMAEQNNAGQSEQVVKAFESYLIS